MLKDLSEAVRGMLNDAGYVFAEEYEVPLHQCHHFRFGFIFLEMKLFGFPLDFQQKVGWEYY